MLVLYGSWRSSAAYRVRIACEYKGIVFENRPIELRLQGGEQHFPVYGVLNPNHRVPTLVDGHFVLTQSLAILEYIEEAYPERPLLPDSPIERAKVRALAYNICADCHPLNALRVMKYLAMDLQLNEVQREQWRHHWIQTCFEGLELQLEQTAGDFCYGDALSLADLCLIPQVHNAKQQAMTLAEFPKINTIYQRCLALEPFILAAPENQPDAKPYT